MHQTRELHRDASTTLYLQESIRLHQESLRQFKRGLEMMKANESIGCLLLRLDDVTYQLEYYAGTTATILEQQRNLLNLVRASLGNATVEIGLQLNETKSCSTSRTLLRARLWRDSILWLSSFSHWDLSR